MLAAVVLATGGLAKPASAAVAAPVAQADALSVAIPAATNPSPPSPAAAAQDLAPNARSAVVMDFATGRVLFEKDAHERLPMASITKIMTLLLTMEAIDSGRLKLSDKARTSEYAASMGGSQIFLEPGEVMTVEDLIKGIAIASANDACVALAEHLEGSEEAFVRRMNERAKELGMDDTHFVNSNGLPAPNHYSSAHDIAVMSRELLKHEQITRWTSIYSDYLRKDSDHPLWLVNTNKLVRFYDGVDGLKTGYTAEAKYCLAATAKRDGFRVIAVVMGEPKPTVRNAEVAGLLNWTFNRYTSRVLYRQGEVVKRAVKVSHGVPQQVDLVAGDTVGVIERKGEPQRYEAKAEVFQLSAPVKQGQSAGTLRVYEGGELVAEVPLLAAEHVRRAGLFQTIGQVMRDLVTFGSRG
ncbi:MAG: D-alanyl-D-alanine carboxypeptidase [Alicyclobacillaceae bacterium]|nr:D-alanyl-D-alanine carboxypeptidase [Alicyclobacillaceae bacterium]